MKKLPKWTKKKWIIAGTALTLTAAIGAGILLGGSKEPVNVYAFQYIGMTEFWGDSQESYGPVSTDKIQTVFLSDTQTVTEILVEKGDTVKKGDVLMTFDTSLNSISLERKELELEKLKLQLEENQKKLEELKNTQPVDPDPPSQPSDKDEEEDLGPELEGAFQISEDPDFDGSSEEKPLICWLHDLADISDALLERLRARSEALQAIAAETQPEETQPEEMQQIPSNASAVPDLIPIEEIPVVPEESTSPSEPEPAVPEVSEPETPPVPSDPEPEPSAPSEPETVPDASEPETQLPDSTDPSDPTDPTEPPEDPQAPEVTEYYVIFKVTDKNMALGQRLQWQGMHILGYADHGFSFRFFDASAVEDYTLIPEEEETEEDILPDFTITYTSQQLAQMRRDLNKQIKELEFNIRLAEAEYKIMQAELSDGNIYAEIDGEVVSLLTEEEAQGGMQPLIKVSGGGGFFVEGSVSELEKDRLKPGQEVTINDWNTGNTYTGEVRSIGDFPSGDDNWNGMGNPTASYYPFQVFISGEADLQAGRYVSVTYSTSSSENGVYLENPFVRTEQGRSYVFAMDKNGKLEKRYVTVGKSLWGSYKEILSGVSEDDFLAFPYGKEVVEGAPAVESDLSALYTY